jgi:hypothetical protein
MQEAAQLKPRFKPKSTRHQENAHKLLRKIILNVK